jgi:uncharacterized protein YhdP
MKLKKLKKIIKSIWQLALLIAVGCLLLYTLLMSFIHLATPYLQRYNQQIIAKINEASPYPIQVERLAADRYNWQPVLLLKEITIFSVDRNRVLLRVDEVDVGINLLRSLWHQRLEIGLLRVKGTPISLQTSSNGRMQVGEFVIKQGREAVATAAPIAKATAATAVTGGAAATGGTGATGATALQPVSAMPASNSDTRNDVDNKDNDGGMDIAELLPLRLKQFIEHNSIIFDEISFVWQHDHVTQLELNKAKVRLVNDWIEHNLMIRGEVVVLAGVQQRQPRQVPSSLFTAFLDLNNLNRVDNLPTFALRLNFNTVPWNLDALKVNGKIKASNLTIKTPSYGSGAASAAPSSSGNIKWRNFLPASGAVDIKLNNCNVTADKWFDEQFPQLENLSTNINWYNGDDAFKLTIDGMQLDAATFAAHGGGSISWPAASPHGSQTLQSLQVTQPTQTQSLQAQPTQTQAARTESLPTVNLLFNFSATQLHKLHSYFPVKMMQPGMVDWLKYAFSPTGTIDGIFTLKGDLQHFPFNGGVNNAGGSASSSDGLFKVNANLHNLDLRYDRDWPQLTNLDGKLVFTGMRLDITAERAKIFGVPTRQLGATIEDLSRGILVVDGHINSDSKIGQNFINASPLRKTIGRDLENLTLGGQFILDLNIMVPLRSDDPAISTGKVSLSNNNLLVTFGDLRLQNVNGVVNFVDTTMQPSMLTGLLFDRKIAIQMKTVGPAVSTAKNGLNENANKTAKTKNSNVVAAKQQSGASISAGSGVGSSRNNGNNGVKNSVVKKATKIEFSHSLPVSVLQKHFAVPAAPYISGEFAYHGVMLMPSADNAPITLDLVSDLHGVKINFPLLLTKDASSTTKHFNTYFVFTDDFDKMEISIRYEDKISAALAFASSKDNMKFTKGMLRLGDSIAAKVPATTGLSIAGKLDKVEWGEWQKYLFAPEQQATTTAATAAAKERKERETATEVRQGRIDMAQIKIKEISKIGSEKLEKIKGGNGNNGKQAESPFSLDIINDVDVVIGRFHGFGQELAALRLVVKSTDDAWLVNLQNQRVSGRLSIPYESSLTKPIIADFQKLYLVEAPEKAVQSKVLMSPRGLPAFVVAINDLHYGEKFLGRLELEAVPMTTGIKISKLKNYSSYWTFEAIGQWAQVDGEIQTTLQGKCESRNVGAALKQLKYTDNLDRGVGAANFNISWDGAFYSPDVATMDGDISLVARNGRIINLDSDTEAKMGIGKLLTIIGLQTLPRRLILDFSDLTKKGFTFDTLKGTLKLVDGNGFTKDVELNGPVGQVKLDGRIGFAKKNYDMQMSVVPRVTSSLPFILGALTGPVVALPALAAEKVIGAHVSKIAARKYKIKGTWTKPDIQKM